MPCPQRAAGGRLRFKKTDLTGDSVNDRLAGAAASTATTLALPATSGPFTRLIDADGDVLVGAVADASVSMRGAWQGQGCEQGEWNDG
ncbi:hypothetical protein [Streptomyces sp. NPDC097981]|uniref:hypothetical protein n=1 Tax=Streptomyces sp. NPDC097981 TaxID=3155428 RepID=UPI0033213D3E